jgi:hypothetical protein
VELSLCSCTSTMSNDNVEDQISYFQQFAGVRKFIKELSQLYNSRIHNMLASTTHLKVRDCYIKCYIASLQENERTYAKVHEKTFCNWVVDSAMMVIVAGSDEERNKYNTNGNLGINVATVAMEAVNNSVLLSKFRTVPEIGLIEDAMVDVAAKKNVEPVEDHKKHTLEIEGIGERERKKQCQNFVGESLAIVSNYTTNKTTEADSTVTHVHSDKLSPIATDERNADEAQFCTVKQVSNGETAEVDCKAVGVISVKATSICTNETDVANAECCSDVNGNNEVATESPPVHFSLTWDVVETRKVDNSVKATSICTNETDVPNAECCVDVNGNNEVATESPPVHFSPTSEVVDAGKDDNTQDISKAVDALTALNTSMTSTQMPFKKQNTPVVIDVTEDAEDSNDERSSMNNLNDDVVKDETKSQVTTQIALGVDLAENYVNDGIDVSANSNEGSEEFDTELTTRSIATGIARSDIKSVYINNSNSRWTKASFMNSDKVEEKRELTKWYRSNIMISQEKIELKLGYYTVQYPTIMDGKRHVGTSVELGIYAAGRLCSGCSKSFLNGGKIVLIEGSKRECSHKYCERCSYTWLLGLPEKHEYLKKDILISSRRKCGVCNNRGELRKSVFKESNEESVSYSDWIEGDMFPDNRQVWGIHQKTDKFCNFITNKSLLVGIKKLERTKEDTRTGCDVCRLEGDAYTAYNKALQKTFICDECNEVKPYIQKFIAETCIETCKMQMCMSCCANVVVNSFGSKMGSSENKYLRGEVSCKKCKGKQGRVVNALTKLYLTEYE